MSWIKHRGERVWWNPDEHLMVMVYSPPNPSSTPTVWSSDLARPDVPFNEVQDDTSIILRMDWSERDGEPAEVVRTVYSEERVREELEEIGIQM